MTFDPYKPENAPLEKSRDDWYAKPNKPIAKPAKKKKRKLVLLPNRKYVRYKGTMKLVKQEPKPPKKCIVVWMGDLEMHYFEDEENLLPRTDAYPETIFPSKIQAKKAIWHTVEKTGDKHEDYGIKLVE